MGYLPPLTRLDQLKETLARRHPGWRVWYVPHAISGSVTWCAQRLPLLNTGSPGELAEAITEAEEQHLAEAQAAGHPAPGDEAPGAAADGRPFCAGGPG